ncbi:MAG: hypothetical protein WDZ45_01285 [Flavobacteriaceae bacterium]
MKKTNQILAFSILITMCSFNSFAQTKIAHFDFYSHIKSLPSYADYEKKVKTLNEKYGNKIYDASENKREELKKEYDSVNLKTFSEFWGKELKYLERTAKDKGVNYQLDTDQFGVLNPEKNLLAISKDSPFPKIGHINAIAYFESLPIHKATVTQLNEMKIEFERYEKEVSEKLDKLSDEEKQKLLQKFDNYYEYYENESKRIIDKYEEETSIQVHLLAKDNGYDYMFDSNSDDIIVIKGNEIQNNSENIADVKIGHANWQILLWDTPKISKQINELNENIDEMSKRATSYEVSASIEQDFKNAQQEIIDEVKANIIKVASNKGYDYVFLLSNNSNITVIDGFDLTEEIQKAINNSN